MDRALLTELKEFLAERMVDNMSTEDLESYVKDDLFTYFDKQGEHDFLEEANNYWGCLLYTSPSPRDKRQSRMPSSA